MFNTDQLVGSFALAAAVLATVPSPSGFSGPGGGAAQEPPARHVVLVTVDGLRPEFYLDQGWPAPVIRLMAMEGAHAREVRSVFPSLTLPAHATLVTGALPARHGITTNHPFQPGAETRSWYFEADSVRVPKIYEAAKAKGLVTAAIGWPSTLHAPIDYNLPEVFSPDPATSFVEVIREAATPPGFLDTLEAKVGSATVYDSAGVPMNWNALAWDDRVGAMAEWVLQYRRPNLLLVHVVSTDSEQHKHGKEGERVRRALGAVDRAIARMTEGAERAAILDETTFIVVGDHGFIDVNTLLSPNVWLTEGNLLDPAPEDRWRARFHSGVGAAFLRVREVGDAGAIQAVRDVLAALPDSTRQRYRILEREELNALGAYPDAVLALAAAPGTMFGDQTTGPAVSGTWGATHGYLPTYPEMATGFVAWGAGIRPGARIPEMNLTDVAPLVAALLGLDFRAPDGVLRAGILR